MPSRRFVELPFVLLLAVVGGCSGAPLALPPVTGSLGPPHLPVSPSSDPPVEVYSRVARGALKCWFGPEGSLKKTHVFHAKVDPPVNGGTAEIPVHTREAGSSHGVLRAFAVGIAPSGEGSVVEAQNFRFPEPQAATMIADVGRWAAGKGDCSVVGTGGWDAAPPPPAGASPAGPVATKSNSKRKPAAGY